MWQTTDELRRQAVPIVTETADRTVAAWERLAEKDLLPEKMRTVIGQQILSVAATVGQAGPSPVGCACPHAGQIATSLVAHADGACAGVKRLKPEFRRSF